MNNYTNILLINKNKVSLKTDVNYQCIEITYNGTLNIVNLLPNNYLFAKGEKKIIIVKMIKNENIELDLFEYIGVCVIRNVKLITLNKKIYNMAILKTDLDFWNTLDNLQFKVNSTDEPVGESWDKMARNWEQMDFDGDNLHKKIKTKKFVKDKEADTITTTRELKKVHYDFNKYDKNINIVGNLYTNGLEYKIKGQDNFYVGDYHIHIKTLVAYTGKERQINSKQLVKTKNIKKIKKGQRQVANGRKLSSNNY